MKKFEECLNPKCEQLSDKTETNVARVCAASDELQRSLSDLVRSTAEEFLFDYDGLLRLEMMRTRAMKLLDEAVELSNILYEKDLL